MKKLDYIVAKQFKHNTVHEITIYHTLIKSWYVLTKLKFKSKISILSEI